MIYCKKKHIRNYKMELRSHLKIHRIQRSQKKLFTVTLLMIAKHLVYSSLSFIEKWSNLALKKGFLILKLMMNSMITDFQANFKMILELLIHKIIKSNMMIGYLRLARKDLSYLFIKRFNREISIKKNISLI